MQVIPIFPSVVDNSMRKALVRCQKMAYWQYECGLQPAQDDRIDKLAGKAFASGLEAARRCYYESHWPQDDALASGIAKIYEVMGDVEVPAKSNKGPIRMGGALAHYLERYPFADDEIQPLWIAGKPMIECSFVFDLPIFAERTGLEKLKYTGRFDMLGLDSNGDVWVVDEKTTGRLGDTWGLQWALDSQMTGYVYGAQQLLKEHGINKEVKGAYVNGIAILKYDYEVARVVVPREQWEIERWREQMVDDFIDWHVAHGTKDHRMALDHACALYNSPCDYAKLCKSKNPERLIEGNYVVKRWNPLTREEVNG